ncbi:hypothetical protein B0H11DRAFT_1923725 [Mycena galericulata]|nr:hypothetical protein B0H11DRAFT_1923725 [Mycena galericulata]
MSQFTVRKQYPFLTVDPLAMPKSPRSPDEFSPASGLLSSPLSAGSKSPGLKSPLSPSFTRILHRARSLTSLGSKTSRSRRSTASYFLPPELWLKVFMHIPLYLLPTVTLTCRSFHDLAQPLLFSTISTHPTALPSLALRGQQTSKYRNRMLERLDFFFSLRISPSVVECWVSPPVPEEDGAPTDDLIDTIFDSLSRLPNLKVLGCRHVRLTPRRLSVLQNLQLTTISLELCFGEISDFAVAPSVPLQEVTFRYPDASLGRDQVNPCLLFLSPHHLEQLHATTTSVLPSLATSAPFRKLRTLDIPIECITSDLLIPAFDIIPRSLMESLPEGVLPLLSSYSGPHHFAAAFLRGRNAKRVDISVPCKAHRLEASLVGLYCTLKSLSFSLDGIDLPASLLGTIHRAFPSLRTLAVREPALASANINAVLNAIPRHYSLTDITLHIQGRDKFNLWIPPDEAAADAVSCFTKCHAALLRTYPSLKVVRLLHGNQGACVIWRRSTLSGMFVQTAG